MRAKLAKTIKAGWAWFKQLYVSILKTFKRKAIFATAAIIVVSVLCLLPVVPTGGGKSGQPTGSTTLLDSVVSSLVGEKPSVKSGDSKSSAANIRGEAAVASDQEKVDQMRQRIKSAVTKKQLTAEQAALINTKLDELKKFYQDIANKSQSERRQLVNDKQSELNIWADDNNLNTAYVKM